MEVDRKENSSQYYRTNKISSEIDGEEDNQGKQHKKLGLFWKKAKTNAKQKEMWKELVVVICSTS